MKKTPLILLLFSVLLPAGCTKEYITEETYIVENPRSIADYTIRDNQWGIMDPGVFYARLDVPEITRQVLDKGDIKVSRRLKDDKNQTFWTPLPIVRAEQTELEDGSLYFYSTYIDYEWTAGTVYIYVTATDYFTGISPGDMDLRVTVFE